MASQRVIVDSHFGQYEKLVEKAVGRGLERTGHIGARAGSSTSTKGYKIGGIVSNVTVTKPRRGRKGLELDIVWRDFRAIMFESGTYKRRRKKLAQARRSTANNRGVKAIRFMAAAKKAAQAGFVDALRREMPK